MNLINNHDVEISVVIPAFNEADALPLSLPRIDNVLSSTGRKYEILVVDDGSSDSTRSVVSELSKNLRSIRYIRLQKNQGHMAALSAGLNAAQGIWTVTIDADLQDPPEIIPEMIDIAERENVDIVYGIRSDRSSDTIFKRNTANLYYKIIRNLVQADIPMNAADFRLMSRLAVDTVNSLPERNKVFRLLIPWLGFPYKTVYYTRSARVAGASHYSFVKMFKLAWNSVLGFSSAPLRIATWLGITGIFASITISILATTGWVRDQNIPGWTSLVLLLTFFSSLQLLSIGLLGEYVGKIYMQGKNRPEYLLEDSTDTNSN
jgi:glycosyltransferase involved in cell wall biosynthesis